MTTPTAATDELQGLLGVETTPKLTIVLPIDHSDSRQNEIRTRNLVKRASDLLGSIGVGADTARGLTGPIADLVSDAQPFPRSIESVVVFSAPDHRQLVPLPIPTPELVHAGDEFHMAALIASLDPIHCYVLTIARGGCRLSRADRWRLTPIDLPDAPEALSDVTWFRDLERQLQLHSTIRGGSATFHGQGVDEDVEFEPVRTYLRAVDTAVRRAIGDSPAPLLLVGPGRLPAIYRDVSALRDFLPAVESHPNGLDESNLHAKASAMVHRLARDRTVRLLDQIGDLGSAGKSSTDPSEITEAARGGRVRTLLFDPLDEEGAVNQASLATLRHGGVVLPVVGAEMSLAAVFRY